MKRNERGKMEEESWRRSHGEGFTKEESWRRDHGGGILDTEEPRKRNDVGGIWGTRKKHLEACKKIMTGNHGGTIMGSKSWRRNHVGNIMEGL